MIAIPKIKKLLALILAVVIASAVLTACAGGNGPDSPETDGPDVILPPTETVAVQSEHYTITNDKFAYFFYKDMYDAVEQYYESYFQYYGLDMTKDLKAQQYSDTSTWFDYFLGLTLKNVANYLYFAEAAIDNGFEMSDNARAQVENELDQLRSAAQENGESVQSFLDRLFGNDLTIEAVKECMELYYYGNEYFEKVCGTFTYTDDQLDEYYKEHESEFLFVNYRLVEVRADQKEYLTEADQQKGFAEAKKKAEYIAQAKDISEFVERGVAYYTSINDTLDEPLTDDEIYRRVTNIVMQYSYNENTAFGRWAFDGTHKDGDITMLDNGAGIYTVYYLQDAPYRAENNTKNIRIMTFSVSGYGSADAAKEAADGIMTKWEASGKTGEEFEEIAPEGFGNLQENVDLGDTPAVIDTWLFYEPRTPGDCALLEGSGAYYIVYFESDGEVSWEKNARESLLTIDVNTVFNGYREKYPMTYNYDNMNLLSGETPYMAEAAK